LVLAQEEWREEMCGFRVVEVLVVALL